jgi:hypothetical protein
MSSPSPGKERVILWIASHMAVAESHVTGELHYYFILSCKSSCEKEKKTKLTIKFRNFY